MDTRHPVIPEIFSAVDFFSQVSRYVMAARAHNSLWSKRF